MAKGFIKTLYNSSRWCKLVILLTIIIAYYLIYKTPVTREGFIQQQKFLIKQGTDIYDPFYASVYDDLVFDKVKNEYEIGKIIQATGPTNQSLILDIGSGTGDHVASFVSKGYNAVGLDISPPMVAIAREKYPNLDFSVGNATEVMLYPAHTFTHITCLYFTIYDINNKFLFFRNCYEWRHPGGYLTVHLVDRDSIDPLLTNNKYPLLLSEANKVKIGDATSYVRFNNFKYKSKFNLDNDFATFDEVFTDPNGKVRKNIHHLYMPSQKKIIQLAQDAGFVLEGKIDLLPVNYGNQYIYIFYKPD